MPSEQTLSANEEFTNFVTYFANHDRNKEVNLKEAIESGAVTTEQERDEFLLCTEPLEPGFHDLPEEKKVIFDMPEKSETIEGYAEATANFCGRAVQLLERKDELGDDIDPRIVEFVEKLSTYRTWHDRLHDQVVAELKDEGLEGEEYETALEEGIEQSDVDSGEYVTDMNKLDEIILEARGIVGHPEPIAIPDAPAPAA